MKTKIFDGKEIKIRTISKRDLRNVKKFQDFINSLIEEGVQILLNKKFSFKEEKKWLEETIKEAKKGKRVSLMAENKKEIIGITSIIPFYGRQNHIGELGINIRKGYRRMGLGSYLLKEIIKLAKRKIRPRLRIIRMGVFSTNKPAINLYKKSGFKIVAEIPKQFKYKRKLISELIMLKEI